MLKKESKIFIAGHNGMVGSSIYRELVKKGYKNILVTEKSKLNLLNQADVLSFFLKKKIDIVIIAAAKVGGIIANSKYPANFIYENLQIQLNLINSAHEADIKNLIFLGSSCIYPKFARQPIKETELLNGYLEPTNEPYAIAKIAGIKLCESYNRQFGLNYLSLMPTNLFGSHDNFDKKTSHVVPGLIAKFHEGKLLNKKKVEVWGTGKAQRELMHVDDLADACIFIMKLSRRKIKDLTLPMQSHINIGSDLEISIRDLAFKISNLTGYQGKIIFNSEYPDGTPRKKLCTKKIKSLGWKSKIGVDAGLIETYKWYLENR